MKKSRRDSDEKTVIRTARMKSPVGRLTLYEHKEKIVAVDFEDRAWKTVRWLEKRFGDVKLKPSKDPAGGVTHLKAYFKGDLGALKRIPVDTGGTSFQRAVWRELKRIPVGRTASYGDLARRIGRPKAVRAVGLANGSNPVAIIVPCHRCVGSDGKLTGYGGGLDRKSWLLIHEGAALARSGKQVRRRPDPPTQLILDLGRRSATARKR